MRAPCRLGPARQAYNFGMLPLGRVLFIESGPRSTGERSIRALYGLGATSIDVLTCFDATPQALQPARGSILSIHSEKARSNRNAFIREIASSPYDNVVILTVGSRIMERWAALVSIRMRNKAMLIDGEGNLNPLTMRRFASAVGKVLAEAEAGKRIAEVMLAPFNLCYLVAYCVYQHTARRIRIVFGGHRLS